MKHDAFRQCRSLPSGRQHKSVRGFTLIELLVTVAIGIIVAAMAVPTVNYVLSTYRLRAAVSSVTGAIQTTRYQAIQAGYAYQVLFSQTNKTFQVQSDPNRTGTFANVGNAIPLAGTGVPVVLGADTTLQFRPSGLVSATAGSTTITLTYGSKTETITVTSYGNVKVTP
ncbi:MAG TPA: GspH/FimT family pseudopilin [Candidatus Angelobacter sp.]|nr:GspH/FimT family pseudopilin [Candidatus Angelobacter sp.]